jgi:hypothetical protein
MLNDIFTVPGLANIGFVGGFWVKGLEEGEKIPV